MSCLYFEDHEINKPIEEYFNNKPGDRLTAPDNGAVYILHESKSFRTDIISWDGLGGIHYYPTITIDYLRISTEEEPNSSMGGYLGGLDIETSMNLKPTRLITKEDIKIDPERWRREDIGGLTNAFLSEKEAQKAIDDFKEKYLKDWGTDYDKE